MTIDQRNEIGKQERVALAVLGCVSLLSLLLGYGLLLHNNNTTGFIVITVSGVILLVVLIINSVHYTDQTTYHRLALLLNPNARDQQTRPPASAAEDSPPPYKNSWAKAFKQKTTSSSCPSCSTSPHSTRPQGTPVSPSLDHDLERHLVGKVAVEERRYKLLQWSKLRRVIKQGKRRPQETTCCVSQREERGDQETQEENNNPPPFEVAILELSVAQLARINATIQKSNFMSTSDTIDIEQGYLIESGRSTEVFTVEEEFRRPSTATTDHVPSAVHGRDNSSS